MLSHTAIVSGAIVAGAALAALLGVPVHGATSDGVVPKRLLGSVRPFLGDYGGSWNTELTESQVDDISRHDLSNAVLRLSLDAQRRLGVRFYLDPAAAAEDEPLDLLGFGCRSSVGPLVDLSQAKAADDTRVLHAVFAFDWGRCPSRVHAVSTTKLHMELVEDEPEDSYAARLTLLRRVQGNYQAYAKIDGQRRPVEIRRSEGRGGTLYHPELEYCIEDELAETECFSVNDRTTVGVAPGPVMPGAMVFWWTRKAPSLRVEKGMRLLYHEGVYRKRRTGAD